MRIVFYTGIGSNKNGLHTEEEFIKVMAKLARTRPALFENDDHRKYKLKDWVFWSGATVVTTRKISLCE